MKSFKEYIKQRFDSEFWNVAEKYIHTEFCVDDLNLYKLRKPGEIEIDSVHIEHIWCFDKNEMKIKFDVAFSASLIVHEGNHRYDNYEEKTIWLLAECEGDIDKKLDDFKILEIYPYNGKNRSKTPLDDSLVPVISKDELEHTAEDILKKYYPAVLNTPTWLDPMKLANILHLSVEQCSITEDGSVFGRCFFETANTKLYDIDKQEYFDKTIEARTILIDPQTSFLFNLGVVNNTIVHECVHWILHKKAFALAKLYDETLSNISCEVKGSISGQSRTSIDWMEWQANALAPKLQMPKDMFIKQAKIIEAKIRREQKIFEDLDVIQPLIDELAIFFGVSRLAAKIRLVECGFDIARGAFIYIDGKYVPPHKTTKSNMLKNDETFCISFFDLALLKFTDSNFKNKIEAGGYTYVDSHVVLNLPLYVTTDIFGNQILTQYARKHMEECCLVFKMSIKSKVGERYQTECFLNRDKHSTIDFNLTYHNGYENSTPQNQQKILKETLEDEYKMYNGLTQDFAESLRKCKKWRGVTNIEIAERSGLNHETVGRCLKGEASSLNTIILICLAMHLPYKISFKIITDSPHSLMMNNNTHQMYDFVLMHLYSKPMSEIRKFLTEHGVTQL